jgi:hypothetical protein
MMGQLNKEFGESVRFDHFLFICTVRSPSHTCILCIANTQLMAVGDQPAPLQHDQDEEAVPAHDPRGVPSAAEGRPRSHGHDVDVGPFEAHHRRTNTLTSLPLTGQRCRPAQVP